MHYNPKLMLAALALICFCIRQCDASVYGALSVETYGTWSFITKDARFLSSICMGEERTGTISTPAFTINVPRIHLVVRGWDGRAGNEGKNRIELVREDDGTVIRTINAPLADAPTAADFDVGDLSGTKVCIRLVDGHTGGGFAWLGLDEIDAGDAFRVNFNKASTLKGWRRDVPDFAVEKHFGIPFFVNGESITRNGDTVSVPVGLLAHRLLLLGMNVPDSTMYWLGDKLGEVRVVYANGTIDKFPLILGEALWWGKPFWTYKEPFTSLPAPRKAFLDTIRFYPPKPVEDGAYIASIAVRAGLVVDRVEFGGVGSVGSPVIYAVTAELASGESTPGCRIVEAGAMPPDLSSYLDEHSLRAQGSADADAAAAKRISKLRDIIYCTTESFPKEFKVDSLPGYKGPIVRFYGSAMADLLSNIFVHNVADMLDKVDSEGVYRTSSPGAAWYGYGGFGGFTLDKSRATRVHSEFYYDEAWTRDLGRCLNELIALGEIEKAKACADWCIKMSRVWREDQSGRLTIKGHKLPPHICRILQMPSPAYGAGCFENDGHGLTMIFMYNLWRRLPDGDAWLRSRWRDIKTLGDWAGWQLANPEISSATDVLWSDSEATGWDATTGSSIFCDLAQIEALYGLTEMARSIGQTQVAERWKKTADDLKSAGEKTYLETDPKYGTSWTTKTAGFGIQGTLGPILIPTDNHGFDFASNYPEWRAYNEAAYQRAKDFFHLGAMGYDQGFIIESALLLDRMRDAYDFLQMTARALYNPTHRPYIVPENMRWNNDQTATARFGDLGNGVQQAEIVKAERIMAGIDDCSTDRLRIMPRLPLEFDRLTVKDMPVVLHREGKRTHGTVSYDMRRTPTGASMRVRASCVLPKTTLRLGAFGPIAAEPKVLLNGKPIAGAVIKSGDSWWISLDVPEGTRGFGVDVQ